MSDVLADQLKGFNMRHIVKMSPKCHSIYGNIFVYHDMLCYDIL